jgi:hypothetical protein
VAIKALDTEIDVALRISRLDSIGDALKILDI